MPPFAGEATNVAVEPMHKGKTAAVLIVTVGFKIGSTDMVISLDVSFGVVAQAELEVRITLTLLPLVNADVINVLEFVPVLIPFICHK